MATEEILDSEYVDLVVRGEGEVTMGEVVAGKPLDMIHGISFRRNGKTITTPNRELVKDLDSLPMPAYHLLPMDKYRSAVGSYRRLPAMSLFATRGCPGRCTYCYRHFGGKLRRRSDQNVLAEIKVLQETYGIREVTFYDDTFTAFRKTIVEFCETIIKEKIDITWSCFTRVDHIDEPLLFFMKNAGCHSVLFGVESADENILKNIKKQISLEQVKEAVMDWVPGIMIAPSVEPRWSDTLTMGLLSDLDNGRKMDCGKIESLDFDYFVEETLNFTNPPECLILVGAEPNRRIWSVNR